MSFKVAILGNPAPGSTERFWDRFSYGIQVFDLSADQICSVLQSQDHSNGIDVAKLGAVPVNKYEIYGGGRFFPTVTREEIARVMQGVDVMLMLTSNHAFALDYMTMEFYECLIGNSLLDQCKAVVLRIADRKKDDPLFQVNTKPLTADAVLDKSGLNKASNLQHKLYVVADKEVKQKRRKKSKKGKKMEETDVAVVVSQLRARLLGEEVKVAVTAPVKETLSAGKALLNVGQRFSSWVSSLIKS